MVLKHLKKGVGALADARANLQHFLVVANQLARTSASAIILVRGDTSQVLQSTHAESLHTTFRWQNDHVPYDVERTHIIRNVADLELSRAIRAMLGSYRTGFLVRIPVIVEPSHTIALLLHSDASQEAPDRQEMYVLRAVARAMAQDARLVAHEVLHASANLAAPDTFEELVQSVLTDDGLRLLFASDAELIGASRGIKAAFGSTKDEQDPRSYFKSLPCADSLQHLFQRAVKTGVSSPEVEIYLSEHSEGKIVSARLNPLKPLDSDDTLIEMRMMPIGWHAGRDNGDDLKTDHSFDAGAAETFLMESLLYNRSIRARQQQSFVSVRSWRSALKPQQAAALQLIKSNDTQYLGELAGIECAAELEHLVGASAFRYIVPIPCKHSPPDKCLSTAIARTVGAKLNIPVVNAFAHMDPAGSSLPREHMARQTMRLIQSVPGPAIIIDDVATSGTNLFDAAVLLKQDGSNSLSLAWIGGEGD